MEQPDSNSKTLHSLGRKEQREAAALGDTSIGYKARKGLKASRASGWSSGISRQSC